MSKKSKAIIIDDRDNVATALEALDAGSSIPLRYRGRDERIVLASPIPPGHKFALQEIPEGEYVVKYGEPIGRAAATMSRGEHVHVQNVKSEKKSEDGR